MTDQLPADIAEAIEAFALACEDMGASYDSRGFPSGECEQVAAEANACLYAAILKHLRSPYAPTFSCPKCGVERSWLPACAQDGCPLLDMDGEPLGRSALAEEGG